MGSELSEQRIQQELTAHATCCAWRARARTVRGATAGACRRRGDSTLAGRLELELGEFVDHFDVIVDSIVRRHPERLSSTGAGVPLRGFAHDVSGS